MARLRGHARLRENETLYALVPNLKHGDHTFAVGEVFPWHRLEGVTARLLRMLWDQGKIGHENPNDRPRGLGTDALDRGRDYGRAKPAGKPKPGKVRGLG